MTKNTKATKVRKNLSSQNIDKMEVLDTNERILLEGFANKDSLPKKNLAKKYHKLTDIRRQRKSLQKKGKNNG